MIIHLRHASYPIQEFLKFLSLQGNFYSLRKLRNCQRGGYVMSIAPDSFVLSRVVFLILLSSSF
jgi:hypothetical protein